MRVSSYWMGCDREPAWSALSISVRTHWRQSGCVTRKRKVEPIAVAVVSAPAWISSVTWARFCSGVRGEASEKRASRQLVFLLVWVEWLV